MIRLLSEPELVALGKAGDHAAFTELIRRSSPLAIRAIRSIVANAADAEDVMQDTLLKAYKGLAYFNAHSKFSTWLTRIAINSALQFLRRRKNRIELSLDGGVEDGEDRNVQLADHRRNPEQLVIRDQTVVLIRRAVGALPSQLRQYTQRRYFEELPHEQIARPLGISLAAGKSRSLRARQRLESSLEHVVGNLAWRGSGAS